jgi:hypothetical protein
MQQIPLISPRRPEPRRSTCAMTSTRFADRLLINDRHACHVDVVERTSGVIRNDTQSCAVRKAQECIVERTDLLSPRV